MKLFCERQRLDRILNTIQKAQDAGEQDLSEKVMQDAASKTGQQNAVQKSEDYDNEGESEIEEDENWEEFYPYPGVDDNDQAKLICPESVTLRQGLVQVFMDMKISDFFGEDSEGYEAYLKDNPELDPSWMTMEDVFEMAYDYIDRYHWRGVPEYQDHFISLTEPIIKLL